MNIQRNLSGSLVLAAMLAAVGCTDEADPSRGGPGGPSGGKADDADPDDETVSAAQEQHLAEVGSCESLATRGRSTISALRITQTLQVEETRLECLREANDATIDELNAGLADASSDLAGETDDAFDLWRSEHSSFCGLMVEASTDALTKAASVRQAACLAEAELKLAEAIEGFGDLGGPNSKAAEAESDYGDCYDAYEAALEADPDQPEPDSPGATDEETPADSSAEQLATEATEALAGCIQDQTKELEDDIADRVVESFPGRATTGIEGEISKAVADQMAATDIVCDLLVQSSGDGEFASATCEVSTSIWRGALMRYVVPTLGR